MQETLRTILLASLLFISPNAPASQTADCPPPLAAPTPEAIQSGLSHAKDRGFLWRISKYGHDSWLYGTIHVARFEWMFPGERVRDALMTSEVLALEMDPMDPEIGRRMKEGMSAFSANYDAGLPPEIEARLRKQAEASCLPYARIAAYPGELQLLTITLMKARQDGLESAYAIDAVLAGMGHSAEKQVVSLESPESQLATLQLGNELTTKRYLETSLEEMESGKDRVQLRRIARIWDESDNAELERYTQWCDCMDTPEQRAFMHKLLDERNPALADKIDALHGGGKKVFAAVGSLHMFGDLGLPALMIQRGYQVEQISFPR